MSTLSVVIIALAVVLLLRAEAGAKDLNLTFCCNTTNDLYSVLARSGHQCPRYADPAAAIEKARDGSAVLILADGYPASPTQLPPILFDRAVAKNLRLYVEYPSAVPGLQIGPPRATVWERGAVSSDVFGPSLEKDRILGIQGCRYLPVLSDRDVVSGLQVPKHTLLVVARIAGFDTAVFGLPENAAAVLFELPERNLLLATTKLSGFVTGRYAPTEAWKTIWEHILTMLDPAYSSLALTWEPVVRPAYGPGEKLPAKAEQHAFQAWARWLNESGLLIDAAREPAIHKVLAANPANTVPVPGPSNVKGDGSLGILEGYASAVNWDGSQTQFNAIRHDCNAESAMVLAMDWQVSKNERSRRVAGNLADFIYFKSGLCKGPRANPRHPAYGLIAWGDVGPAWLVANYGDDNARGMLATIAVSANLGSDKWDVPLLRALLANLRTTGPQGFRGDRIDIPALEANGWKYYHDEPRVNYALNFEAYLWACYLWAYRQTGYPEFLERTRTAIKMTMEAYPDQWRWGDSMERVRILLPLAWLVRVDDTPEHRAWLRRIVDDLITTQDKCGALPELLIAAGSGEHYVAMQSNEAYGTGETPLVQQDGDCASDQLYTSGYALIGLHEGFAATGDPVLKQAEDKLADYLVRIQVHAPKQPYLDGTWFRGFDYRRWDYWASSGDAGWGVWSAETGWAQAWTALTFGLRVKNISFWDMTAGVNLARHFAAVRHDLAQTPEGPFRP